MLFFSLFSRLQYKHAKRMVTIPVILIVLFHCSTVCCFALSSGKASTRFKYIPLMLRWRYIFDTYKLYKNNPTLKARKILEYSIVLNCRGVILHFLKFLTPYSILLWSPILVKYEHHHRQQNFYCLFLSRHSWVNSPSSTSQPLSDETLSTIPSNFT